MKKIASIAFAVLAAGCLSSAPKAPVSWLVEADTGLVVSSVNVATPYDGTRFTMLRSDGSVAFDSFNVFAARPGSLIKSAVLISREGPELFVRRIALDCRKKGERTALVELELRKDAKPVASASGTAPTDDGDYSAAFSAALRSAAAELRKTVGR